MSYKDRVLFGKVEKDDYTTAIESLDAEDILSHFGAENIQRKGNELIHSCLIDRVDQHHQHGDGNPSAAINVETKKYNCFSFGGGDIFWFLEIMEGSIQRAVEVLGDLIHDGHQNQERFIERLSSLMVKDEVSQAIPKYSDIILKRWEGKHHPFLFQQGISEKVMEDYRIGYNATEIRIIFPHLFQGKLVGWQKMAVPFDKKSRWPGTTDNSVAKYLNSPAFPKHQTVFNIDRAMDYRDDVIVTEGVKRVYRAESFEDRPFNVVSTFSAQITEDQSELLRPFRKVYVMFDGDYAGYRGANWGIRRLMKKTEVFYMLPPKDFRRDLADMEPAEVQSMKDNALPAPLGLAHIFEKLGS